LLQVCCGSSQKAPVKEALQAQAGCEAEQKAGELAQAAVAEPAGQAKKLLADAQVNWYFQAPGGVA
jgi:hypothetical protein